MGTPLNFKCCASVWANDDSEMHSEINIKQMFFDLLVKTGAETPQKQENATL